MCLIFPPEIPKEKILEMLRSDPNRFFWVKIPKKLLWSSPLLYVDYHPEENFVDMELNPYYYAKHEGVIPYGCEKCGRFSYKMWFVRGNWMVKDYLVFIQVYPDESLDLAIMRMIGWSIVDGLTLKDVEEFLLERGREEDVERLEELVYRSAVENPPFIWNYFHQNYLITSASPTLVRFLEVILTEMEEAGLIGKGADKKRQEAGEREEQGEDAAESPAGGDPFERLEVGVNGGN